MVQGQLYRVGYTGRSEGEIWTIECLIVAASADDARTRFPYIVDLSEFSSYRVDYIAKEPGRAYQTRAKVERSPVDSPDAVIKRPEGSASMWQQVAAMESKKWEVYARTTCFAKNPIDAQRKLSQRLSGGSERVECVASELAPQSGYAEARDMSMFGKASFVQG